MAPRRPFSFQDLLESVRQGGSQAEIIRRFRGRGFGGGNDALRGLIKIIRGTNVALKQFVASLRFLTRFPSLQFRIPNEVAVTVAINYTYRVARDELGRPQEVLLSGKVEETRDYVFPTPAINEKLITEQALARAEERVARLIADAGLAQAGNYLMPEINASPIRIVSFDIDLGADIG